MSFIEFDSVYKTYKMGEVTINAADGVTCVGEFGSEIGCKRGRRSLLRREPRRL